MARPPKHADRTGFLENAFETGIRFTLLFSVMWSSSEPLSTFGGPAKSKGAPVDSQNSSKAVATAEHSAGADESGRDDTVPRAICEAQQDLNASQNCDDDGATRSPNAVRELLPPRVHDSKENTLSPLAQQLQCEARKQLHARHDRLKEQNRSLLLDAGTRAQAAKAARYDRQSLEALEKATARATSMMQRPQKQSRPRNGSLKSIKESREISPEDPSSISTAVSRELHRTSAPPSSPPTAIPAPRGKGPLPRIYSGTCPDISPTTPTGSSFQIHSIPEDTTDSDLFREDCQKLFSAPLSTDKAPLDIHQASTLLNRLEASQAISPSSKKIHEWMAQEVTHAFRGASRRSGGKFDLEVGQALFEEVLALTDDVEDGTEVENVLTELRRGQYVQAGSFGSESSWNDVDHRSDGALEGEEGKTPGMEDQGGEIDDVEDDCQWLDLGSELELDS